MTIWNYMNSKFESIDEIQIGDIIQLGDEDDNDKAIVTSISYDQLKVYAVFNNSKTYGLTFAKYPTSSLYELV